MPEYTRELTRTVEAGLNPAIDVRNVSGSVRVRGEERGDVLIVARARFRVPTDDAADELMRSVERGIRGEGGSVYAHSPAADDESLFGVLRSIASHGPKLELGFEISAPRGSSLTLKLVNGPIEVKHVDGNVKLKLVNGRFELADLGGDLSFQFVNANGSVRRIKGSLDLHYTNGDLAIERPGDVTLQLVNGRIDIREPQGAVSVRGVSGSYALSGAIRDEVSITNAHGRIRLDVPADSRFELDAVSSLGRVTSELDVRDQAGDGQGRAPRVKLRCETGSIELRKLRQAVPAGV